MLFNGFCDGHLLLCSYLHKIIHFLLSVYLNQSDHLSNNLLLQGSKSGKSTVCKSLYYFYMLQKNTPYTPFYFLCIPGQQQNQPSYTLYTIDSMFNDLFPSNNKLTSENLFSLQEYRDFMENYKENSLCENNKVQNTLEILLSIVDQNLDQFKKLNNYTLQLSEIIIDKYYDLKNIKIQQNDKLQKQYLEFQSSLNYEQFVSQLDTNWFNIKQDDRVLYNRKIDSKSISQLSPLFIFDEVLSRHRNNAAENIITNSKLIYILQTLTIDSQPSRVINISDKYQNIQKISNHNKTITIGEIIFFCCPLAYYYMRKVYQQETNISDDFLKQLDLKQMTSVKNFETIFIRDFQLNFSQYIRSKKILSTNNYLHFFKSINEGQNKTKQLSNYKQKQIADEDIFAEQMFSFLAGTDSTITTQNEFCSIVKLSNNSRDHFPLVFLTYQGQSQFHPKFLGKKYYIDLQNHID